jgi:hypothetical protein
MPLKSLIRFARPAGHTIDHCPASSTSSARTTISFRFFLGLLLVALIPLSCSRGPREPSEAEMRGAVQSYIDGINRNIEEMGKTPPDRNNPMSMIQSLGGAILKGSRLEIGAFKKLSAGRAPDGNGYIAFYDLQLRATGNAGSVWDSILRTSGERCSARFINTDTGWIWIPPGQDR